MQGSGWYPLIEGLIPFVPSSVSSIKYNVQV